RISTTRAPIASLSTPLPVPPSLDSWKGPPSKPSKSASRPNIAPRSPKARIFRGALYLARNDHQLRRSDKPRHRGTCDEPGPRARQGADGPDFRRLRPDL